MTTTLDNCMTQLERYVERDGTHRGDRELHRLRAQLDKYERAPTVARVIFENHAREVCDAIPREHLPPVGTEPIARPTRKGEA